MTDLEFAEKIDQFLKDWGSFLDGAIEKSEKEKTFKEYYM